MFVMIILKKKNVKMQALVLSICGERQTATVLLDLQENTVTNVRKIFKYAVYLKTR